MAVEITLFNYKKKKFSTATPSKGDGDTWDCRINRTCSVISPELVFDFSGVEEAPSYNYAYIDSFNRWYFIDNWTYNMGLWYASCSVDALASWWDDIRGSTQYVLRNANTYDTYLPDTFYPATDDITFVQTTDTLANDYFVSNIQDGTFILGVLGGSDRGCISYYAMNYTQFSAFSKKLFNEDFWLDTLGEIWDEVTKKAFNPIEYIASCFWLPIPPSKIGLYYGTSTGIKIGWWSVSGISYYELTSSKFSWGFAILMPSHPQIGRGRYLNAAPYTMRKLVARPFGEIVLDSTLLNDQSELVGYYDIDLYTGKALLRITSTPNEGFEFATARATLAVNLPIAQASIDLVSAVGGMASLASSFVGFDTSKFDLAEAFGDSTSVASTLGSVGKRLSGVGNVINSLIPQIQSGGSTGSCAEYYTNPLHLDSTFFKVVQDSPENRGRPLCQEKVLSSLSGYTMCDDVVVEIQCTENERTMIKSILEGGFYIE